MIELNYWELEKFIKHTYPERIGKTNIYRKRQANRWIQIHTPIKDSRVHYECIHNGIELHFEDGSDESYAALLDSLIQATEAKTLFNWGQGYKCRYNCDFSTFDEYCKTLSAFISYFDELIVSNGREDVCENVEEIPVKNENGNPSSETVEMKEMTLMQVMQLPLTIPDYQRDYCWCKANVKCLLYDITNHIKEGNGSRYRLGTLILHHNAKGTYDIIDGQQRLTTLAILLRRLGVRTCLLDAEFKSKKSQEHISYNKYLLENTDLLNLCKKKDYAHCILDNVEFSVLVLQGASLDLAYTFFSTHNSRGVPLTDYDLLKAHHLRYIPSSYDGQAKRAAKVWNNMVEQGRHNAGDTESPNYVRLLDTYIYRLRRWMRKHTPDEERGHIKREYESAPLVAELPPFGEKFHFNEPIQGGAHFFSFVERQLAQYKFFTETTVVKALHNKMTGSSQVWYRDVIEGLLFGYYLKFGQTCLADALILIMKIIAGHRYIKRQARKFAILQYAAETEIIMMIEQASSPTFFLQEAYNKTLAIQMPKYQELKPIQRQMRQVVRDIAESIKSEVVAETFKNINK